MYSKTRFGDDIDISIDFEGYFHESTATIDPFDRMPSKPARQAPKPPIHIEARSAPIRSKPLLPKMTKRFSNLSSQSKMTPSRVSINPEKEIMISPSASEMMYHMTRTSSSKSELRSSITQSVYNSSIAPSVQMADHSVVSARMPTLKSFDTGVLKSCPPVYKQLHEPYKTAKRSRLALVADPLKTRMRKMYSTRNKVAVLKGNGTSAVEPIVESEPVDIEPVMVEPVSVEPVIEIEPVIICEPVSEPEPVLEVAKEEVETMEIEEETMEIEEEEEKDVIVRHVVSEIVECVIEKEEEEEVVIDIVEEEPKVEVAIIPEPEPVIEQPEETFDEERPVVPNVKVHSIQISSEEPGSPSQLMRRRIDIGNNLEWVSKEEIDGLLNYDSSENVTMTIPIVPSDDFSTRKRRESHPIAPSKLSTVLNEKPEEAGEMFLHVSDKALSPDSTSIFPEISFAKLGK
ncbi:hypothetical protein PCE1_001755 [Barthelona sp. PCE]